MTNSTLWGYTKRTDGGITVLPNEYENGTLTADYSLIKDQNPTGMNNMDASVMVFER